MREERRQALAMLAVGRITAAWAARVPDGVEPAGVRRGGAAAGERRYSPHAASDPAGRARLARGRPERAGTE